MKAARLPVLVLVVGVVLVACDAAPAATPSVPAQASPGPTGQAATTPAGPDLTHPVASPSLPAPAPSDAAPSAQPTPSGDPGGSSAWSPVRGTAYDVDPYAESAVTSDGGLYLAVTAGWMEGEGNGTLTLAALDGSGEVRSGWPVVVPAGDAFCHVAVAPDDSLRAVCGTTAYAFDLRGRRFEGWPVDLGGLPQPDFLVQGDLLSAQVTDRRWVVVRPDGSIARRKGVMPGTNGYTATIKEAVDRWGEPTTAKPWRVTLSNGKGVLPGWPVKVPGSASEPVVGPDGTVYLVALGKKDGTSQLIVISRTGKRIAGRAASMKDVPPHDGSWYGPYIPQSPVVGRDGSVWVVGESSAYAFDPKGRLRAGWPVRLRGSSGSTGFCGSCDTDCYYLPADPFVDRAGRLYVFRAPSSKAVGGSVLAIGLDGKVVPGWPVQLKRAGSEFWNGTVGPDGTVFVDAYEPEPKARRKYDCPGPASLTTLAIRPDSTVRYRVTLIDP